MKNKPTDMTWRCGCRMYEDGINMVWDKCALHQAAPALLAEYREAILSLHHLWNHVGYFDECGNMVCNRFSGLLSKTESIHV